MAHCREGQTRHVVVPTFGVDILHFGWQVVVTQSHQRAVAVGSESDLDPAGARGYRSAIAFPAEGEHHAGVGNDL